MIARELLASLIYGGLAALIVVGLASALSAIIVRALARIDDRDRRHDAQAAADHGEPTREQVEAGYGPLAMWGPTDAEADAQWADLLAPFDLTPAEVRERWEQQWAETEAEIDAFRAELDAFGGAA